MVLLAEGGWSHGAVATIKPGHGCGDDGPFRAYSGSIVPDPPSSAGKSFSFGSPSFIGSTVSA